MATEQTETKATEQTPGMSVDDALRRARDIVGADIEGRMHRAASATYGWHAAPTASDIDLATDVALVVLSEREPSWQQRCAAGDAAHNAVLDARRARFDAGAPQGAWRLEREVAS